MLCCGREAVSPTVRVTRNEGQCSESNVMHSEQVILNCFLTPKVATGTRLNVTLYTDTQTLELISEALSMTSYVIQRCETGLFAEGQGIPYLFANGFYLTWLSIIQTPQHTTVKMIHK
jgi:hypothetical protein